MTKHKHPPCSSRRAPWGSNCFMGFSHSQKRGRNAARWVWFVGLLSVHSCLLVSPGLGRAPQSGREKISQNRSFHFGRGGRWLPQSQTTLLILLVLGLGPVTSTGTCPSPAKPGSCTKPATVPTNVTASLLSARLQRRLQSSPDTGNSPRSGWDGAEGGREKQGYYPCLEDEETEGRDVRGPARAGTAEPQT